MGYNSYVIQKAKNIVHGIQSLAGHLRYGFPSRELILIGVTGTDGKTTTVNLIHAVLTTAGKKSSFVSSINARIGNEDIDTGFHVTTPDPWIIPQLIRKAVDAGSQYLVLEVSSHGLDQNRVLGCQFSIGVLTNISHEHLDYHKTFENYSLAKLILLQKAKTALVNADDSSYNFVMEHFVDDNHIVTFAIKNHADITPKKFPFKTQLPGLYNQYNCLAAIAVGKVLGLPNESVLEGITKFQNLQGRFEETPNNKGIHVIIDFAHKPNALKNVLETARQKYSKGRIIAVFGVAGERDKLKRPMMGNIAAKLADITILTAEDPRTEDVNTIIDEIAKGAVSAGAVEWRDKRRVPRQRRHYFIRIPDRQEAISYSIRKIAQKDDTVLFLGKGHEKSMCYGKTEFPWNEHTAVQTALRS